MVPLPGPSSDSHLGNFKFELVNSEENERERVFTCLPRHSDIAPPPQRLRLAVLSTIIARVFLNSRKPEKLLPGLLHSPKKSGIFTCCSLYSYSARSERNWLNIMGNRSYDQERCFSEPQQCIKHEICLDADIQQTFNSSSLLFSSAQNLSVRPD